MTAEGAGPAIAPCPHFGFCGGCDAQDMGDAGYLAWKRGFLEAAIRRAGIEADMADPVRMPPQSRRRARFFADKGGEGLKLGFHGRGSHEVVDMTACLVLDPALFALTAHLRGYFTESLRQGARGEAEAQVVSGTLDVLIRDPAALDMVKREELVGFAGTAGIARLSYQVLEPRGPARKRKRRERGRRRSAVPSEAEIVIERQPVTARFGAVDVRLPPLAFLQATADGEAYLAQAVCRAVPDGARVADLFSGAGTFTFPLVEGRRITAVDGDAKLIEALDAAARAAGLGGAVSAEVRNLSRRPLSGAELAGFDAVVIDPPRAGAEAQARVLAGSAVPRVVMVSCNPASFARDAAILLEGGYTLGPEPVTPVDQFVWTRHLELVAVFSR